MDMAMVRHNSNAGASLLTSLTSALSNGLFACLIPSVLILVLRKEEC